MSQLSACHFPKASKLSLWVGGDTLVASVIAILSAAKMPRYAAVSLGY